MSKRQVKRSVTGNTQTDGAGVKLVRVLGPRTIKDFDPFLMMDCFDSKNPDDYTKGFPWHPHRGIETITYLIHGKIEHGDSLGNKGVINDGCCQWMTAGSGIIHQEMPIATPQLLGAQLWLNLPKERKMTEPEYRDIRSEMVPEVNDAGAHIRVLSGYYKKTKGAVMGSYAQILYLDVTLEPETLWTLDSNATDSLFVYIIQGSVAFEEKGEFFDNKQAVLFGEGSELYVRADKDGARLLVLSGTPLKEPVAWGGPIVMNSNEELQEAFRELENDTFIKHK